MISRAELKQAKEECKASIKKAQEFKNDKIAEIKDYASTEIYGLELDIEQCGYDLGDLKARIKEIKERIKEARGRLKEIRDIKRNDISLAREKCKKKCEEAKHKLKLVSLGEWGLDKVEETIVEVEIPEVVVSEEEKLAYEENMVEVELIHKPFKLKNKRLVPIEEFDFSSMHLQKYRPEHRAIVEIQGMATHDYDAALDTRASKRRAASAYKTMTWEAVRIYEEYSDEYMCLRSYEEPDTKYYLKDGSIVLRKDMEKGDYELADGSSIRVKYNEMFPCKLFSHGCKNKN